MVCISNLRSQIERASKTTCGIKCTPQELRSALIEAFGFCERLADMVENLQEQINRINRPSDY